MENLVDLVKTLIKNRDSLHVKRSKSLKYDPSYFGSKNSRTNAHIRYSTDCSYDHSNVRVVVEREVVRRGRHTAPDDVWNQQAGWFFSPVVGCTVIYRMKLFDKKKGEPYETHEITLGHTEEAAGPSFRDLIRLYYQFERQYIRNVVEAGISTPIVLA